MVGQVKLARGVDEDGRSRVVNGLRSAINNNLIFVQDTESINESVQRAASALNLFFVAVAVVALTLCFFAAMLSFSSNIRENAREFGILRALGLDRNQVLRCYLYEAGAVVFASFLLGSIVGACALTGRSRREPSWLTAHCPPQECSSRRR